MRPENLVPLILVLAGVAAVIAGVASIYWPAGLILAGLLAIAGGILLYEDGRTR